MKHNYLTLVLVVLMSLVSNVVSAHDFEVGGIYYNITSSTNLTVAVTYRGSSFNSYSNEYTGKVTIPETVTYNSKTYRVTSIGNYAFFGCDLTSITIPSSVTSIRDGSFAICASLTSINIPNSVTSIGEAAFYGCSGLTSVTIPNNVTSIGNDAFSDCSGLTSITIPNNVTSIGGGAFSGCSSLTSIVVEEGNTIYDSRKGCNAIIETTSNVLIVGCNKTIIPEGIISIGDGAFLGCDSLTSVIIPNSVTSIGSKAFSGCSGLTSVTIPNNVTSIGGGAFSGCSSLTSIVVEEGNTIYDSRKGCNAIIETASNALIVGCNKTIIPEGIISIGIYAFYGCSGLTSVTINSKTIASKSYSSSSTLAGIFGAQVKNYVFGNDIQSIGAYACYNCSGLTSVTIPESVTSIGGYAFYNCNSLTKADFTSVESLFSIAFGNIYANPLFYSHHLYVNGEKVKDLVIPNNLNSIGNYSFAGYSGLTSVNIPNGVTKIGYMAFMDCKLHDVFVNSLTPPIIYTDTFSEQVFTHAKLYVPAGCWDTYAYDAAWYKFINIRETATTKDQVSVQKAYTLMDVNAFTYSVYDPVNDCIGTIATSNGINEDNPNHCWQIVEQGKEHYLYNIGAKKFAKRVDNNIVLTDSPVPIEMKDGDKGLIIGEQSTNQWALVHNERMSVNQSPITGISPIINTESQATTCYDLSGRKLSKMQRGINIIRMNDGTTKKVLVK